MQIRSTVLIVVIVVAGLALAAAILWFEPGQTTAGETDAAASDYPRGPHGGRLLSDGPLQVEVTIYETGVPPQFRVYPFDGGLAPLSPDRLELEIELHRLGGRVDRIAFTAEGTYLRGDAVVEEPHSFDVVVAARHDGRSFRWTYSQVEGKVKLGADQVRSAGIAIATVGPREMVTTFELPAEVRADQTRVAHVVPRLPGVMVEVLKQEGDPVTKGELLAIVSSRELADAKAEYLAATQRLEFSRVARDREEALWEKKISAEQDYLEAKRAFDEAALSHRLAAQTLVVLGVPADALAGLASAPVETMARYDIRSPLDGTVTLRDVTVGEAVAADERIFTVTDLSSIWVDITVYARDLGAVREGQAATILSADLGSEVSGHVSYVGPLVGQETRAATARVVLSNPGRRWRPGLFVTVRLVRAARTVPLAVSVDAIQTFRDWQVVFVRYGDWFEARPLELGQSDGRWIEVLAGLQAGEQYAAANSFAVKAEIGKLGATHDH